MQETQGRYPGVGIGNSLQYSCLEHFMERSLEGCLQRVGHNLGTELCCAVISQAQLCPTLGDPMDSSLPGSSVHWDSPGKNTGVGSHFLPQGIFLTQEQNMGLMHCRQILYQLSYQGRPQRLSTRTQNKYLLLLSLFKFTSLRVKSQRGAFFHKTLTGRKNFASLNAILLRPELGTGFK